MAVNPNLPDERIVFRSGQRITAVDLNQMIETEAAYRSLHFRYVHRVWGILQGLEVSRNEDLRAVKVASGFALDGFGRVIVHKGISFVPCPTSQDAGLLVIRRFNASSSARNNLICCGVTEEKHSENTQAKLFWQHPEKFDSRYETPLAFARFNADGSINSLSHSVRHYAKHNPPRMFKGETKPGRTDWEILKVGEMSIGIQVVVDTSSFGFIKPPNYFAWTHSMTVLTTRHDLEIVSLRINNTAAQNRVFDTGYIVEASESNFVYQIAVLDTPGSVDDESVDDAVSKLLHRAERDKWTVTWVAFEPQRCEFDFPFG